MKRLSVISLTLLSLLTALLVGCGGSHDARVMAELDRADSLLLTSDTAAHSAALRQMLALDTARALRSDEMLRDRLGSVRAIIDGEGTLEQALCYTASGLPYTTYGLPTDRHMHTGLEQLNFGGLGWYDNHARWYDPVSMRFTTPDPLAEKYFHITPFAYCANNPMNFIDRNGMEVRPYSYLELEVIRNTLPFADRMYVVFGSDGSIDKAIMSNHNSESYNYNSLLRLVNDDMLVNVKLTDCYDFLDKKGIKDHKIMTYQDFDPLYDKESDKDLTGETLNGTSTGESGYMGKTLFPDNVGYENSTTKAINVCVNFYLSQKAAAEMMSHELYGHALLYILNNHDHLGASHQFVGLKDTNKVLIEMILKAKQETIKNMNNGF